MKGLLSHRTSNSALILAGVLAVATAAPNAAHLEAQGVMAIRVERLAPNIHVVSGYANGNILLLSGDDGLLLVDAQSERRVAQADSAIRAISTRPVRVVVNTHYHSDHVGGNAHWRQAGAVIVAHENVRTQASKDTVIAEWDNWKRTAEKPEALPTLTFRDSLTLHLNGEQVSVVHVKDAHTDGDAIIRLRRANVLHVGDLVELGAPPFIDWWTGGSIDGMIAAVDAILPQLDATTRVVPGHGPVTDREGVRAYREMLVTIRDRVNRLVAEGNTLEQTLAAKPTAEFDARLGGERFGQRLVKLVYVGVRR